MSQPGVFILPTNLPPRSAQSTNADKPHFSLEYLVSDYCLDQCDREEKAAFADKLQTLSRLTWQQINQSPRHGLGKDQIAKNAINAPIPKPVTADVNLIAIRFHTKALMVGYRDGRTFYIIWLDRGFTL